MSESLRNASTAASSNPVRGTKRVRERARSSAICIKVLSRLVGIPSNAW
ncbi:MAG: hypothetical protein ABSE51_19245 [Terracidiphilus sp.]